MSRFATVTDEELKTILEDKSAKHTKLQTKTLWNIFVTYLKQKQFSFSVEHVTKCELDNILCKFWVEVRKIDGEYYKKTSFRSLRYAIQRHMKTLRGETFDIIDNVEFAPSNNVYNAQLVVLKKCGFAKIDHHPPITDEDMKRLYSSGVLSLETPIGLQRKVFFELMLHLCRRGLENLRDLTINDFVVKRKNGVECVLKVSDEMTKNHREDQENQEEGLMIATGTAHCPVAAFKLYVQKLNPKLQVFFQRPKAKAPSSGPWYDNMVVGVKTLETMMKKISAEANLSESYTNHCIRATCITILDQNNTEARHILSVTGQSSESSLRSYAKTSTTKRQEMSSLLASKSSSTEPADAPSTSSGKRPCPMSSSTSLLARQQQLLAQRFNMNTLKPNFNLLSGLNLPDSDDEKENGNGQVPSENQLRREFLQLQQNHSAKSAFSEGTNYYKDCTIHVNPVIINKVVNKRRRIQIESDSSQE